jgi:fructose-1,6-bisphosphatase/inositol monophosphatase family enzyme
MEENTCTRSLRAIADPIIAVVYEVLKTPVVWKEKADKTPVSNIDLAIQAGIIGIIREKYKDDNVVCEEDGEDCARTNSDHTWVIDPIDGTDNFINSKREFGISVGLMQGNEFVEALLLFPGVNEIYYAGRGAGIWKNGSPYHHEPPEDKRAGKEIILCSKTYLRLRPFFERAGFQVNFYKCATYSLLMLLKREALFYMTINTMIYDVGPMSFIIGESGIRSFNAERKVLDFSAGTPSIPFFAAITDALLLDDVFAIVESGMNI